MYRSLGSVRHSFKKTEKFQGKKLIFLCKTQPNFRAKIITKTWGKGREKMKTKKGDFVYFTIHGCYENIIISFGV